MIVNRDLETPRTILNFCNAGSVVLDEKRKLYKNGMKLTVMFEIEVWGVRVPKN